MLADFIVECSAQADEPHVVDDIGSAEWWEVHTNGAASANHCGGGVMITTTESFHLYYALQYQFRTSNNEAEYEAVIGGLRLVQTLKATQVRVKTDSCLVVRQLTNECETRE